MRGWNKCSELQKLSSRGREIRKLSECLSTKWCRREELIYHASGARGMCTVVRPIVIQSMLNFVSLFVFQISGAIWLRRSAVRTRCGNSGLSRHHLLGHSIAHPWFKFEEDSTSRRWRNNPHISACWRLPERASRERIRNAIFFPPPRWHRDSWGNGPRRTSFPMKLHVSARRRKKKKEKILRNLD